MCQILFLLAWWCDSLCSFHSLNWKRGQTWQIHGLGRGRAAVEVCEQRWVPPTNLLPEALASGSKPVPCAPLLCIVTNRLYGKCANISAGPTLHLAQREPMLIQYLSEICLWALLLAPCQLAQHEPTLGHYWSEAGSLPQKAKPLTSQSNQGAKPSFIPHAETEHSDKSGSYPRNTQALDAALEISQPVYKRDKHVC